MKDPYASRHGDLPDPPGPHRALCLACRRSSRRAAARRVSSLAVQRRIPAARDPDPVPDPVARRHRPQYSHRLLRTALRWAQVPKYCGSWCNDPNQDHEGTALGVRQDRHRRVRDASCSDARRRAGVVAAAPPRRSPRPASRSPRRRHHRRAAHPRPPRRHAAPEDPRRDPRRPRRSRRTTTTWPTYGIEPFDLVVSNLYPFAQSTPASRPSTSAGRRWSRAAAKNHACVAVVTDAPQYDAVLDELRRRRRRAQRRHAPRARGRGVRAAPPPTTPRSSRGSQDGEDLLPPHIDLALERTGEQLRYGENPHQARRALPHHAAPRAGGTASSSTAASRSATSTSTTPTPRGGSCTTSATEPDRSRSSSTPTRAASRSPTTSPTAYQRALECDERSAFGGIVALNRPVDAATVERMVAGPQADLVIAPGYERRARSRRCRKKRKNTRLLEAPAARGPTGLDFRQISRRLPRAGRRTTSPPAATTGASSPSARPPRASGATPSWRGASAAT